MLHPMHMVARWQAHAIANMPDCGDQPVLLQLHPPLKHGVPGEAAFQHLCVGVPQKLLRVRVITQIKSLHEDLIPLTAFLHLHDVHS